jgi:hypothetical protein
MEERFEREARLTGLLQHPGIPPVHMLGQLSDGRPYFIMKLIQGSSLQELLSLRSSPAEDLPGFLGKFTLIGQTVGYAHARGVIHRDLKPANVMVGAHGEVQVMDWGLAKVLRPDKAETPVREPKPETVHRIQRTPRSPEDTADRSLLGTPEYMAPEQARGEIDNLDARADVFALGAILCTILTGASPYRPGSAHEVARRAAAAELDEARESLASCGADAELVALAQRCLAPRKEDRPANGAAVAAAVAAYQAELARRLRQAEIDRAAAAARAEEESKRRQVEQAKAQLERQRRRTALALAAAVVVLVVASSAAGLWYQADQARQQTELELRRNYVNKEVAAAVADAAEKQQKLHMKLLNQQQVYLLLSEIDQWERMLGAAKEANNRAQALANGERELLNTELVQRLKELNSALTADEDDWKLGKNLDELRLSAATSAILVFDLGVTGGTRFGNRLPCW